MKTCIICSFHSVPFYKILFLFSPLYTIQITSDSFTATAGAAFGPAHKATEDGEAEQAATKGVGAAVRCRW